jgi:site-specific recombinase XerD
MNGEFYTEDQIRGLLDDCSPRWPTGIRDRALISLIYGCGARISEALALDVPDLRPGRKVHIACGKGGKPRTVGCTDRALDDVGRWLQVRDGIAGPKSPLFCTLKGGPVARQDSDKMIKRRGARSSLGQRAHMHGLRHSHAVALLRAGVPVTVIMRQLGHASLAVTTIYLNHLLGPDELADAVQGISLSF